MGMPLTKYSMLRAIGYGKDSYLTEESRRILSPYKLFGLILHDPKSHPLFHNKLKEIFSILDRITGDKFMFLTLTNPPVDWRTHTKRDYFKIFENEELIKPHNAYETTDEGLSAYTIAKSLNIDFENLPCIVLTTDFSSKDFAWIKTDEKFIEDQFKQIGQFCNSTEEARIDIDSDKFKAILKNINYCNANEIRHSYSSLAKHLSDFLSFVLTDSNAPDSRVAVGNAKDVLDTFATLKLQQLWDFDSTKNDCHSVWSENELNFENQFEDHALRILGSLAHLEGFDKISDVLESPIPEPNISYYSGPKKSYYSVSKEKIGNPPNHDIRKNYFKIFKNYFKIKNEIPRFELFFKDNLHLFENESRIVFQSTLKVEKGIDKLTVNFDYSLVAIGYSKVFEKEINLSVIHWVRNLLAIEMPQYFNKVKPGGLNANYIPDLSFIPNPHAINFNKSSHNNWLAPGLGESQIAVKSLIGQGKNVSTLEDLQDDLLEKWRIINGIRNRMAHTEILSYDEYQKIKDIFDHLYKKGTFQRMLKLKAKYRGY